MACCGGMLVINDDTTANVCTDGMVPDLFKVNNRGPATSNKPDKYVIGPDSLINNLLTPFGQDVDALTTGQLSQRLSDLHLSSIAVTNLLATNTTLCKNRHLGNSDMVSFEGQERRHFWQLFHSLLLDCERAPKYDPDCMNINNIPPTRRWYVSHYSLVQDLLQRHTGLRRMTLILRWLELTYRSKDTPKGKYNNYVSSRSWVLDNDNDPHSVKESIFEALRRGDCSNAVRAANIGNDGVHACVVECARMQIHEECWFSQTSHVPLFGEYCYTPSPDKAEWTSNEHRMDHLAAIFELSNDVTGESCGSTTLERAIYALLSGNSEVLGEIYDTNRWQDRLWVSLRCALVGIFTRVFAEYAAENEVRVSSYHYYLLSKCENTYSENRDAGLNLLVEKTLAQGRAELSLLLGSSDSSLAEEMQLRLIIHALDTKNTAQDMFQYTHEGCCVDDNPILESNDVSFLAAVMIACDAAHQEGLMVNGPQDVTLLLDRQHLSTHADHCSNNITAPIFMTPPVIFANTVTTYFCGVVMDSDLSDDEAVKQAVAGLLRIRDSALRGRALAFVIVAARKRHQHRARTTRDCEEMEMELLRHIRFQDREKYTGEQEMYTSLLRALPMAFGKMEHSGESQLLTKMDMPCECLLWESMACTSREAVECVDKGLSCIEKAWKERNIIKVIVIVDILNRLIFSVPIEAKSATLVGNWESPFSPEFPFWANFAKVVQISNDHSRSVAILQTAIHSNGKLAVVRSKQLQVELLNSLLIAVDDSLSTSMSITREGPQYCNGAPLYCAELLANACTLAIQASYTTAEEGTSEIDRLLLAARQPVGVLAGLGLLEGNMVLTKEAQSLFDAYKTVRIAFSRRRLGINNAAFLNQ